MSARIAMLLLFAGAGPLWAAPVSYRVEPTHTAVYFAVDHLGFSIQRGRFDKVSGSVQFDREADTGMVDIVIDTTSVSSGDDRRDRYLRSDSFLDTDKYPDAHFQGSHLQWDQQRLLSVDGTLTLHGVTKPVTLQVNRFKCGWHWFDMRNACGADAALIIKRSDYDMNAFSSSVGDEISLTIQIEAIRD